MRLRRTDAAATNRCDEPMRRTDAAATTDAAAAALTVLFRRSVRGCLAIAGDGGSTIAAGIAALALAVRWRIWRC
jgi:hypothetical protein